MNVADQCKKMGLQIGDTIKGREECGKYWNEAKLTILWIGESAVMFKEVTRSESSQKWSRPIETADWTLDCRPWTKIKTRTAPKAQP